MRYRKTRTFGEEGSWIQKLIEKIKMGGHKSITEGLKLREKVEKKVPDKIKSHVEHSLNFTNKSPSVQGLDSDNYSHTDKTMIDFTKKGATSAESALVLKGEKHISGIISLNIKNNEGLSPVAKQSLMEIIEKSKGKGLADYRGDYIFVVFSPLITKTYGNENLAVKCAMSVVDSLVSYNKKFKDKIEFGVGVHSGDLISSKEKGKLKYTGIGNTVSFAKRMSDVDSGKVIVSDTIRKKLIRDLKAVKGKEIGEKQTWVVTEVSDRSGDAAKLKQLMDRNV